MNKYEFELQKLQIRSVNVRHAMQLVKHFFSMATGCICVWLIFRGLTDISAAAPASVSALALLAEKLQISQILGYAVGAIATGAWYVERKGKKRLIQEAGQKRKQKESGDPYRGSSGLTDTGDTPS
ncbi:hypothetical protein D3C72_271420 [compost metagenome]